MKKKVPLKLAEPFYLLYIVSSCFETTLSFVKQQIFSNLLSYVIKGKKYTYSFVPLGTHFIRTITL